MCFNVLMADSIDWGRRSHDSTIPGTFPALTWIINIWKDKLIFFFFWDSFQHALRILKKMFHVLWWHRPIGRRSALSSELLLPWLTATIFFGVLPLLAPFLLLLRLPSGTFLLLRPRPPPTPLPSLPHHPATYKLSASWMPISWGLCLYRCQSSLRDTTESGLEFVPLRLLNPAQWPRRQTEISSRLIREVSKIKRHNLRKPMLLLEVFFSSLSPFMFFLVFFANLSLLLCVCLPHFHLPVAVRPNSCISPCRKQTHTFDGE